MCLTKITEHGKNLNEERIGYKVFSKNNNGNYQPLYKFVSQDTYYMGGYHKAQNNVLFTDEFYVIPYVSGFHILKSLEAAHKYRNSVFRMGYDLPMVICKVKYNSIICGGEQDGMPCDVTNDMCILEEVT